MFCFSPENALGHKYILIVCKELGIYREEDTFVWCLALSGLLIGLSLMDLGL